MVARILGVSFLSLFLTFAAWGRSSENATCRARGEAISFNNSQVLQWKSSTPNAWQGRGHVQGLVVETLRERDTHLHFLLKIGPNPRDVVEVVYNNSFGDLPELNPGSQVVVCGDYITAHSQNGKYPPSPAGAIIHWVHGSPNGRHEDGFVAVGGRVFGQRGQMNRGRSHMDF